MMTAHALVRWLERAEGRDLSAIGEAYLRQHGRWPPDGELLAFAASYCGLDIKAVEARILTPNVRAGIRAGASSIRLDSVRLVISRGKVATVLPAESNYRPPSRPILRTETAE